MSGTNEIKINIIIAERSYRLTVNSADEEKVRKAADILNERVKQYKQAYDYRDFQDLLAMICLQFATLTVKYEADNTYKDQYLEQKLDDINALLSEYVES